jgi:ankyrin repeat protein
MTSALTLSARLQPRDEQADRTALMLAAENGHTEVVLALIAKSAEVNAKNSVRLYY